MREVTLPSGAVLKIQPAPFAAARTLYQAVLRELYQVPFSSKVDVTQAVKDVLCITLTSPAIEAAVAKCLERCTYSADGSGDLRITDDLFTDVERRQDFIIMQMEVAQENMLPFEKSLFVVFRRISNEIEARSSQK